MRSDSFSALAVIGLLLFAGCGSNGNNQVPINVADVAYSVDASGCLISQNAEAVINYANGSNMSKTFIWNCAVLNGNTQRRRYEEFFVSYDGGQCFSHYQESASAAICTERAVAPGSPSFEARIVNFDVIPVAGGSLTGYEINAQLANTGNSTLYDLYAGYADQYSFVNGGVGWLVTAPGVTRSIQPSTMSQVVPSKSFNVTLTLKMWDGSVLDTQTRNVVIP